MTAKYTLAIRLGGYFEAMLARDDTPAEIPPRVAFTLGFMQATAYYADCPEMMQQVLAWAAEEGIPPPVGGRGMIDLTLALTVERDDTDHGEARTDA